MAEDLCFKCLMAKTFEEVLMGKLIREQKSLPVI